MIRVIRQRTKGMGALSNDISIVGNAYPDPPVLDSSWIRFRRVPWVCNALSGFDIEAPCVPRAAYDAAADGAEPEVSPGVRTVVL